VRNIVMCCMYHVTMTSGPAGGVVPWRSSKITGKMQPCNMLALAAAIVGQWKEDQGLMAMQNVIVIRDCRINLQCTKLLDFGEQFHIEKHVVCSKVR
jgi:hypothetical protein